MKHVHCLSNICTIFQLSQGHIAGFIDIGQDVLHFQSRLRKGFSSELTRLLHDFLCEGKWLIALFKRVISQKSVTREELLNEMTLKNVLQFQ